MVELTSPKHKHIKSDIHSTARTAPVADKIPYLPTTSYAKQLPGDRGTAQHSYHPQQQQRSNTNDNNRNTDLIYNSNRSRNPNPNQPSGNPLHTSNSSAI